MDICPPIPGVIREDVLLIQSRRPQYCGDRRDLCAVNTILMQVFTIFSLHALLTTSTTSGTTDNSFNSYPYWPFSPLTITSALTSFAIPACVPRVSENVEYMVPSDVVILYRFHVLSALTPEVTETSVMVTAPFEGVVCDSPDSLFRCGIGAGDPGFAIPTTSPVISSMSWVNMSLAAVTVRQASTNALFFPIF